jgi:hypothetical protein
VASRTFDDLEQIFTSVEAPLSRSAAEPFRLSPAFHCETRGQPLAARPPAQGVHNSFTVNGL